MRRKALILVLGLIYAFSLGSLKAEQIKEKSKGKLSLRECIRISLDNSPDIKIGNEGKIYAQEEINEYRSFYWPKISFSTNTLLEERAVYSYSSNINARWKIFDMGRRAFALEKVEEDYLSSQWQERLICQEAIYGTASTYIQRVRCEEIYLLAKEILEEEERRLEIIKARSEEGFVPKLDVINVEAEIRQMQIFFSNTFSELKISKSLLNHAMGFDLERPTQIEGINHCQWIALIDKYSDVKDCFKRALLNRLDYKIAECSLKAEEMGLERMRAEAGPELFLETSYRLPIKSTNEGNNFSTGLILDMPLFEGGLKKARIEKVKARVKIAQFEIEKLKREIFKQIADIHEKLKNLQEELGLQEEKFSFLSENLEAQKALYNNGISDIIKLNDAHSDYVSCRLKLSQIRSDILFSFLLLLREMGEIEVITGDFAVTKSD